ncbi:MULTISPECIES: efflux RND transporter periplasmic adaptor subunit [Draconibacterium]|uniref:RND transporter n=1 Tax=Draconibacterium sediminis TaxID=1544798 RepID=A0A0D8JAW1_9BACT|nr:efflux RND transporter periplasmic adaptor subunit [Draconibacterium sediminis]KJF43661.1 RND transporter [Draconibacterium sediminis]
MIKKIILIAVAIAILAATAFKLKTNKEVAEKRVYKYDIDKPITVKSIVLKPENAATSTVFAGNFQALRESKLSTDVQGKVLEIYVDQGSMVEENQALIQLDNSLLKLQLQSVEVKIEELTKDVKRYKVLTEADAIQGIQLEKTELALKSALIQKATLLEQINKTTIRAPFNAVVTAKMTEEGAFAAPGIPLLQITDISILKFTVNVPENSLSKFELNKNYTVSADAFPDIQLSGQTTMLGSKANIGNSFPVQLLVKNTNSHEIKSGMFGKVILQDDTDTSQITIPASALVGTTIKPQVYLIENGRAQLRDIIVAERIENRIVIAGGLKPGDEIVSNGFINLYNNANVNPK